MSKNSPADAERRFQKEKCNDLSDVISVNQIEWRAHGFEGSRLGYLLGGIGMFHRSHRAVDNRHALLEILAHTLSGTKRTALSLLLENAR
jgi:DNA polymerase-3 subunit epsilon